MEKALKLASLWRAGLLSAILFFSFTTPGHAIDVTLEWDATPGATYYVVYWGQNRGAYAGNSGNIDTRTYNFVGPDDTYYFVVQAFNAEGESPYSREVCVLGPGNPDLGTYDRGWAITSGDLNGFMVLYDSNDPTPTLGPSSHIPPISNIYTVGLPLNLQLSGATFMPPATIFLPSPNNNASNLNIYYWDGKKWILANDANDPDTVQSGAEDWMVAGTRYDHDIVPPFTIEFQVNHFSGAHAGVPADSVEPSSGGGGGGCFIDTAAFGSNMDKHVQILSAFKDKWLLSNQFGRRFVDIYYKLSPLVADYLRRHPTARTAVRYALIPVTGVAFLSLHIHPLILLTCLAVLTLALTFAFRFWLQIRSLQH